MRDYLATPNADTQDVVRALIARVVEPETVAFDGDIGDYFWDLWNVLMAIVGVIPHDHPAQQRLVDVVGAIARSPTPQTTSDVLEYDVRWPGWSSFHLPDFNIVVGDMWMMGFERDEWMSLNAFMARILASAIDNWEYSPLRYCVMLSKFSFADLGFMTTGSPLPLCTFCMPVN